ncbi:MAG: hypothetical protein WBB07_23635 [Mycobacterium sp.]
MRHTTLVLRCRWFIGALGRNPLIRASDRVEALAVLMIVMVGLLAVPFASQAGDNAYDARMRVIDEQQQTRHSIEAVAVADNGVTAPARFSRPGPVHVEWREGTEVRNETISVPTMVKKGDSLTIWLDNSGKVVSAPDTPQMAGAVAAGRTWVVWIGTVSAAILLAFGLRYGLDRARARSWERELQLLAHNDDGWANRNT